MTQLFSARPGTVFRLEKSADPDAARDMADQLLQEDLFRCYGIYGSRPTVRVTELLSRLGGLSVPPAQTVTVESGDETRIVLGVDVVRGNDIPPKGTTYERPAASGAKDPDSPDLMDKSFVDVPLGGPATVGLPSGNEFAVETGQAYLSDVGSPYSLHIPSGHMVVEFVLAEQDSASAAAWHRYVREQPNPNV